MDDVWVALDLARHDAILPLVTRVIALWLPVAIAVTGVSILVYVVAQQSLRRTADELPAALAYRTVGRLESGVSPYDAESSTPVDMRTSLDPFVLIFNADGQLVSTPATLDGQPPQYPTGVFDTLRTRAEDRVTWQPQPGVRDATVVVAWNGGFVVGSRSLAATDDTLAHLGVLVVIGWAVTLLVVAGAAVLIVTLNRSRTWPGPPSATPPAIPQIAG